MSPEELIHFFVRAVANGGGITINVGPAADGKIPLLQQERLEQLGEWIGVNEEAIYASESWIRTGEEREVLVERMDPQIDFNWVRNSPVEGIAEDHFTASWTGFIQADYSEEYQFLAEADEGMRLYVDGELVLDLWDQQAEGSQSEAMREREARLKEGRIQLQKGKKYPIKVEFHERLQEARISLQWESPSLSRE